MANGSVVEVAGFRYPTKMAAIRLDDGTLFIWSPIALTDALRAAVDALGDVRWLIAPNTLHHLFVAEWQRAYPRAVLHAPLRLRKKRKDLNFTPIPVNDAAPWSRAIDHVTVGGNLITTEVVFFHKHSRTVLFTDLIQHFDRDWFTGWRSLVARLDGLTSPEPRVPRKFRYAFVDRQHAREALKQIVAWPTDQLVFAHGPPLQHDARAVVARALGWLSP
nr:DUF4336 domain-containing protein [Sphingomonas bacterium]